MVTRDDSLRPMVQPTGAAGHETGLHADAGTIRAALERVRGVRPGRSDQELRNLWRSLAPIDRARYLTRLKQLDANRQGAKSAKKNHADTQEP